MSIEGATMTREQRDAHAAALIPMVHRLAADAKRRDPRIDLDGAFSDGQLALLRAIDTFDPARGTPLRMYAWCCVSNAVREHLRRLPRVTRREGRPRTVSLDDPDVARDLERKGLPASREEPSDERAGDGESPEWLRRLTPDELALAELLAEGVSNSKLAWLEGTTPGQMRERILSMREKVRCWGGRLGVRGGAPGTTSGDRT